MIYGYDLAGRIISRGGSLFQSILPSAVTSAAYDPANRLTMRVAAGVTVSPTFDANGSLTNDGVNTYSWDARDQLSSITGVASYVYDGFGRRQAATRGGTTTSFLYDFSDVVQEQQSANPSLDSLLGLGVDERLSRNGSTLLVDALGSTVALVSNGATQTNYGYDPYGASQITGTSSDNSFQFTGRENDGAGVLNYRNRYYSAVWGRFLSEDPIGLRGGINLYAYADNDPAQLRDPSGHFASIVCLFVQCGRSGNAGGGARPTPSSAKQASDPCAGVALCSDSNKDKTPVPEIDRSGKVHGQPFPTHVPADWTDEDKQQVVEDLEKGIEERERQAARLGEDPAHRIVIEQQRDLLRRLMKVLSGT